MTTETLTDEERESLADSCRDGLEHKCLRCIDQRDAEIVRLRGALTMLTGPELDAAQADFQRLRAEVARLTQERDEARQLLRTEKRCNEIHVAEKRRAETEVTSLTAERDEARKQRGDWAEREYAARTEAEGLKREVARLTEALAAKEHLVLALAELKETLQARIDKARAELGGVGSSYSVMSRIANARNALNGK